MTSEKPVAHCLRVLIYAINAPGIILTHKLALPVKDQAFIR